MGGGWGRLVGCRPQPPPGPFPTIASKPASVDSAAMGEPGAYSGPSPLRAIIRAKISDSGGFAPFCAFYPF